MRVGLSLYRGQRGHYRIVIGNVKPLLDGEWQFAVHQSRFQFGRQPIPALADRIPERDSEPERTNLVVPKLHGLYMQQRPTEIRVNGSIRTSRKQPEVVGKAEDLGLAR